MIGERSFGRTDPKVTVETVHSTLPKQLSCTKLKIKVSDLYTAAIEAADRSAAGKLLPGGEQGESHRQQGPAVRHRQHDVPGPRRDLRT